MIHPHKILLPLDLEKRAPQVFEVINRFAQDSALTVTLLHVISVNVVAFENRLYEDLDREAHFLLEQLARTCLPADIRAVTRVRFGRPAREILAQAAEDRPDLLLLSTRLRARDRAAIFHWGGGSGDGLSRSARKIVHEAPCHVLLVPVRPTGLRQATPVTLAPPG